MCMNYDGLRVDYCMDVSTEFQRFRSVPRLKQNSSTCQVHYVVHHSHLVSRRSMCNRKSINNTGTRCNSNNARV